MSEANSSIDAALYDRLVDGELDPRTQAELLSRLDDQPGEWRRLALAFVEAQTLGIELRGIAAECPRTIPPEQVSEAVSKRVHEEFFMPWSKLLSLAATMLVAVSIGFGAGRFWHRQGGSIIAPTTPTVERTDQNDLPKWPTTIASQNPSEPRGTMTVRTADGSPFQLPVYEASAGTEQMLASQETAVPPEVIRALRSRGHEVKQQRRLWPVDLGDGRQIIVPVDQVDVQYVGDRAYQ